MQDSFNIECALSVIKSLSLKIVNIKSLADNLIDFEIPVLDFPTKTNPDLNPPFGRHKPIESVIH